MRGEESAAIRAKRFDADKESAQGWEITEVDWIERALIIISTAHGRYEAWSMNLWSIVPRS